MTSHIKLRPYQKDCLNQVIEIFKTQDRQIIQMPTGAGKTIVFWSLIEKKFHTALIIVPSLSLGMQAYEKGLMFYEPKDISRKFGPYNEEPSLVHICIIHSLNEANAANLKKKRYDLVIVDEAHKAGSARYKDALEKLKPKKLFGVTATPKRNDKTHLSEIFEKLTYDISILDLIKEGWLSDFKAFRYKTEVELKDVKRISGDFSSNDLFKHLNSNDRNNLILRGYLENCVGRKTLVFACNVQHCLVIERLFCANGIKAKAIYGEMRLDEQQSIIKAFKEGHIEALINNQLLTEGFDEPSIDAILIARPTLSSVLYSQMIGRGTRLHPGKERCVLVELTDNYHRICNFWTALDDNASQKLLEKEYSNGSSLLDIEKLKAEYEIKDVKKEAFNVFENEIQFDYLDDSNNFLSVREKLFLRWKERKLDEFKKWQLSENANQQTDK